MSSSSTPSESSIAASPKSPNVKLILRPSHERGNADHGWLKSFHTFSFASYSHRLYNGYGALRVINEDRVEPMEGFGKHTHREMGIFSYLVAGELEHKDSMGNREIMKRGDVQMTSAGTGISHSEYNVNEKSQVHFLQIWVNPAVSGLKPTYYTRHFTDAEKENKLVQIVAPLSSTPAVLDVREGSGPVPIHAGVSVFASILSPSTTVTHTFPNPIAGEGERKAYIHVIQTSGYNTKTASGARIRVNGGLELSEGDGAFSVGASGDVLEIENIGDGNVEFLVFDIE